MLSFVWRWTINIFTNFVKILYACLELKMEKQNNFDVISHKFNIVGICTSRNYVQKYITKYTDCRLKCLRKSTRLSFIPEFLFCNTWNRPIRWNAEKDDDYVKLKVKTWHLVIDVSRKSDSNFLGPGFKFQNAYLHNGPYDCKATNGAIM
jgi:hypothetical protein